MKYWFQDLSILLDLDKVEQFIPKSWMTYPEKVNAVVRLSIYLGVVLSIFNRNYLYLYIPIVTMGITLVLFLLRKVNAETEKKIEHLSQDMEATSLNSVFNNAGNNSEKSNNNKNKEGFSVGECSGPTENNPFMNPLPYDKRTREPACPTNDNVGMKVEKLFNKNLFRSVGDVFNKANGQRQYYTVPSTTYPNDQGAFGKWLYGTPKTCKEGNGAQCVANTHERLNQSSYKFPYVY